MAHVFGDRLLSPPENEKAAKRLKIPGRRMNRALHLFDYIPSYDSLVSRKKGTDEKRPERG
jgi:hypothetical protein